MTTKRLRTARAPRASRAPRAQSIDSPAAALANWFDTPENARELPWRAPPSPAQKSGPRRDPYHALVAESMLQQTQVSRVIAAFQRFVTRFPTVHTLAAADEADVLALWSGLGYYRRAKHLHAAAQMIVDQFAGEVPSQVSELLQLPGVGRYTAGSIASIVFGRPEPIVDGNVMRVLLRREGRDLDPSAPATQKWAWERAAELVAARPERAASINEGLMELGATVCLPPPAAPKCDACPWAAHCQARRDGLTTKIPRPKTVRAPKPIFATALVIIRADGRVLLHRRADRGMWAGLWQVPTVENRIRRPDRSEAAAALGPGFARVLSHDPPRSSGRFDHKTTHRTVKFAIWHATLRGKPEAPDGFRWVSRAELRDLGISNAQMQVLRAAGWQT